MSTTATATEPNGASKDALTEEFSSWEERILADLREGIPVLGRLERFLDNIDDPDAAKVRRTRELLEAGADRIAVFVK